MLFDPKLKGANNQANDDGGGRWRWTRLRREEAISSARKKRKQWYNFFLIWLNENQLNSKEDDREKVKALHPGAPQLTSLIWILIDPGNSFLCWSVVSKGMIWITIIKQQNKEREKCVCGKLYNKNKLFCAPKMATMTLSLTCKSMKKKVHCCYFYERKKAPLRPWKQTKVSSFFWGHLWRCFQFGHWQGERNAAKTMKKKENKWP